MYISKKMLVFCTFFLCAAMVYPSMAMKNETLKNRIESLEQKLDRLEQGQESNKDNIRTAYKKASKVRNIINDYNLGTGAYMRSSYFNMDKDNSGSRERNDIFANYLELKFSAKPTQDVKFSSTLAMYKLFGGDDSIQDVGGKDYEFSSKPSDASVGVKRAYVDYRPSFLNSMVNMEFGRLPTSGGDLTKFRYNRPSQASYPDLAFNGETDGAALTFYLNEYLPYTKSLSLVYTRFSTESDTSPFERDNPELDDIDFYIAQSDFSVPGLKGASFTINYTRVENVAYVPQAFKQGVVDNIAGGIMQKAKSPSQNPEAANLAAMGKTNVKNYVSDNLAMHYPDNLGDVDKLALQFDNQDFLGTPLDIFASFGWSKTHPTGDMVKYSYDGGDSKPVKSPNAPYLNSNDNQDSHSGHAFYVGGRYELPLEVSNKPLLGAEYNYGSKHWIGLSGTGSYDPFKKLNARGHAYEAYLIQPLAENFLQVRGGFEYVDRDYTTNQHSSFFGKSRSSDEDAKRIYLSLDMKL